VTAARCIAAALAAVLSVALGACASTARYTGPAPGAPGAETPGSASGSNRPHPPAGAGERMVDNAMAMLGQPYRYGGAAPGGFDCSGLVEYAASGAGIRVPRTALEQLGAGVPASRGNLQAGDLVFMHLAHKELHVGIAIGGGKFLHAPSTGGYVRIDSLAAPPYARGFIAARRIIPEP